MICNNCKTKFDLNAEKLSCPECGEIITLQKFNNALDAARYVIDVFGVDIIKNDRRFLGLMNDVIPKLVKDRNLLYSMQRENVYKIIYATIEKDDTDKKNAILLSINKLIDNEGISELSAIDALNILNYGLGWNVDIAKEYNTRIFRYNSESNQTELEKKNLVQQNVKSAVSNTNQSNATNSPVMSYSGNVSKKDDKRFAVIASIVTLIVVLAGGTAYLSISDSTENEEVNVLNSIETNGNEESKDHQKSELLDVLNTEEEESPKPVIVNKNADNTSEENNVLSETPVVQSMEQVNVGVFDEVVEMSTKDEKITFKSGVELKKVGDYSDGEDELVLIYEIYNPTEYTILISASDGLIYNKQNEIVHKNDGGYFSNIVPVKNGSRGLVKIDKNLNIYANINLNEFSNLTQTISLKKFDDYYSEETNVIISDIEESGRYVKYKVKTSDINEGEYIYWVLLWVDKNGIPIKQLSRSSSDLVPNSTEVINEYLTSVLKTNSNNPVEKIYTYVYR